MPILSWLLKQLLGPFLVPILGVVALTLGGLNIKAAVDRHDARVVQQCNAAYEFKIRKAQYDADAARIREAELQAENSIRRSLELTDELELARKRIADLPSGGSADPNCLSPGLLDALTKPASRGTVGAAKRGATP